MGMIKCVSIEPVRVEVETARFSHTHNLKV